MMSDFIFSTLLGLFGYWMGCSQTNSRWKEEVSKLSTIIQSLRETLWEKNKEIRNLESERKSWVAENRILNRELDEIKLAIKQRAKRAADRV